MSNTTLRSRLRDWQLRLGFSRDSQPQRGPSNEDVEREQSFKQNAATRVGPDANPCDVSATLDASGPEATHSGKQA